MKSNHVFYLSISLFVVLFFAALGSAVYFSFRDKVDFSQKQEVMRVVFDRTTFAQFDYVRFYDCQTNTICFVAGGDIACVTGSDVPAYFSKKLRGKCNE